MSKSEINFTIQSEEDLLPGLPLPAPILTMIGPGKIGKTSFACKFPKPLLLWTEAGAHGINVPKYPMDKPVEDWMSLLKLIAAVKTQDHDRQTLILDTVDMAQRLATSYVIEKDYKGDPALFEAYKSGYRPLREQFRRLLNGLAQVRAARNMNIVIISHEGQHRGASVHGDDYKQQGANLETECWKQLRDFSDQIGYAGVKIRSVDRKPTNIGGNKRYIFFDDHPGRMAGCRAGYEMPENIELDFDKYAEHMKGKINGI